MLKESLEDTIAAISTCAGQGGIGIVRLSGKSAIEIADRVFLAKDNKKISGFKTYTMRYGWVVERRAEEGSLVSSAGDIIDEVIVSLMRGPASYTREDVVEINCHGGIVALRRVLDLVLTAGARLAEPGEFTKRAFINGRIDLAQAEAVMDIIGAKTDTALKIGAEQLRGALSKEINQSRAIILGALAALEANIDFPEEETGNFSAAGLAEKLKSAYNILNKLTSCFRSARIFREGIHAVICGRPNVGKSSLLNAILKKERSIVTAIAGTTVDTVEEMVDIRGVPVCLVDTAGISAPKGLVEKKAVSRSRRYIDSADLVIILFDASQKLTRFDQALIKKVRGKKNIAVINKIDLKQMIEKDKLKKIFGNVVELCAKKSQNINLLEEEIVRLACKGQVNPPETVMAGNLRHIALLKEAEKFIAQARNSLDNNLSAEFIAQGLKDALERLDIILGKNFSPQLLDKIFSSFCIGK